MFPQQKQTIILKSETILQVDINVTKPIKKKTFSPHLYPRYLPWVQRGRRGQFSSGNWFYP